MTRRNSTHIEAAAQLVDLDATASKKYRDALLRVPTTGSHPDLVKWWQKFQAVLKQRGYPMFPVEWVRGGTRQNQLQKEGFSRARAGQSPHNFGCAVDIVHVYHGWNIHNGEDDDGPEARAKWAIIGTLGKEVARKMNLNLTWGGDFPNFYDPAHWELSDWREYRAAEAVNRAAGVKLDPSAPDYHENLKMALTDALKAS